MDREQFAWAAGLFDGEGHVGLRTRRGRSYDQMQLSITQVDRRVLDKFRDTVGLGRVYGPYGVSRYNVKSQPSYRYVAVHHPTVQAIVAMLWTWLAPVKRAQATLALRSAVVAMRNAKGSQGDRPTCIRGHLFDVDSTQRRHGKVYRARYCRACRRETHGVRRDVRRMVAALLEA